jgi:hypothetical protein
MPEGMHPYFMGVWERVTGVETPFDDAIYRGFFDRFHHRPLSRFMSRPVRL